MDHVRFGSLTELTPVIGQLAKHYRVRITRTSDVKAALLRKFASRHA